MASKPLDKPLSETKRKLLIAIALFPRQHGRAPRWSELRRIVGVEKRREFVWAMLGLRNRGLIVFRDQEPGSTKITQAGVDAVLAGRRKPKP